MVPEILGWGAYPMNCENRYMPDATGHISYSYDGKCKFIYYTDPWNYNHNMDTLISEIGRYPLAINVSQRSASIFDQEFVGSREALNLNCWSYWTHCIIRCTSNYRQIFQKFVCFIWMIFNSNLYIRYESFRLHCYAINRFHLFWFWLDNQLSINNL